MLDAATVRNNVAASQYEATVDGHLAVCRYELDGDRIVFTHTLVPPELRGRGVAELLVRAALAEARDKGRRVAATCSYVAAFLLKHPEVQDLVAADTGTNSSHPKASV